MAGMIATMLTSFGATGAAAAVTSAGTAGVIGGVGTLLSTAGAIKQGNDAKALGNYQAKLAEKRADEERATGIQKSKDVRRQGKLMMSRARAQGAASGGGLDLDLMGDLAEETELRALNAIWVGNTGAADAEARAAEKRFEGRNKKSASRIKAGGTLLGGGVSLMDNYSPVK